MLPGDAQVMAPAAGQRPPMLPEPDDVPEPGRLAWGRRTDRADDEAPNVAAGVLVFS